jgi:hypothetical protein
MDEELLEKAESEPIVPAGHSACQDPAAVAEIKRILRLPEDRAR